MTVTPAFRDEFIEWSKSRGCEVSPLLSIKKSDVGGTGVFISLQNLPDGFDGSGHLEVMRIPKILTMSLDSFAESLLVPQTLFDEGLPEGLLKQSDLMVKFLSSFSQAFNDEVDPYVKGGVSETNILVGQTQMLVVLKKVRELLVEKDGKNKVLQDSPFAQLDKYLELLEMTDVPGFSVDEYYDKFLDVHKYYVRDYRLRIERVKFDAIYTALESLDDIDYKSFVDDSLLRRIELSVISRLLEIPERLPPQEPEPDQEGRYDKANKHTPSVDPRTAYTDPDQTEDENVTEDEEDKEDDNGPQYGFSVSSTLVPIVDFVNHSNDCLNAFFDVDPENGDVLLRLFNDKISALAESGKDEVELFIRYSDFEDALKFGYAYGFVPRSHNVRPLFEMAIDRHYLKEYKVQNEIEGQKYEHKLGLLLKWLHVQPSVQFVLGFDSKGELLDVKMNLDENFIVFGFIKGMKYHKEAALAIVKYYSELQDDEYVEGLLELEESDENDVIGGYDVIPYTSVYVDGEVNLMELVENIPDDEVDQLMVDFLGFFREYAEVRSEELENAMKAMTNNESTVRGFTQLELDILSTFKRHYDSASIDEAKMELIIGSEDCDDEWLTQRLRPRTVPGEKRAALYEKHGGKSLSEQLEDLEV